MAGRYDEPMGRGDQADLPPELEALARRLDHDGMLWRRELPDERRIARGVAAQIAPADIRAQPPQATGRGYGDTWDAGAGGGWEPPRDQAGGPRGGGGRGRWGLAVGAALAIVVLMAGALWSLGVGRRGPDISGGPTATVPTATSIVQPSGAWKTMGTLRTSQQTVFAPSDPRVAYQVALPTPGSDALMLARTDDAGAHYHILPYPSGLLMDAHLIEVGALVSPRDPRTVYLYAARQGAGCSGTCFDQWLSTDGGATWRALSLPVPGVLGVIEAGSGSTLYALVAQSLVGSGAPPPANRMVASTDGGRSWRLADGDLAAHGLGVSDFAASPTGTSVYIISEPANIASQPPSFVPQYQLWRRDDGGASWTLVGDVPGNVSSGLRLAGQTLYLFAPQRGQSLAASLPQASTDGGRHWSAAPTAGLASDAQLPDGLGAPTATLGDGSLLLVLRSGLDRDVYAWQPGATAWRQVAPPLTAVHVDAIFSTESTGGQTTLWAVYDGSTPDALTVASYPLG
ncbi:MAG TPA: sialidase family protein [Ktedonobacterales bacterium]|nr:sialidase family protein [Ktedonobacterales bacterium]